MTPGFTLRKYQQECLQTIRDRYRAGIRRQLICLPTGTGKTVIFALFPRFFHMRHKLLVLAHREELLDQARDKLLAAGPGLKVEIEQGARKASAEADVVVASVPTLGRSGSSRLARLDPADFELLVLDEAHHATAESYRRIYDHFGLFKRGTTKLLVGFTATPKRGDGEGLDAVFEEISFSRTLPEMIRAGFLAPLAGYRVETDVDLSGVRTRQGDFVSAQLSQAVNTTPRNELVTRVYQQYLGGRQTLCFCVDVAHAESQAECFQEHGIPCAAITGLTLHDERQRMLRDFSEGKLRVLTNCMVLTEGYDEPSVSGIILARPTQSTLLYTQMIGRGTRLHPGKENATIIDVVDNTRAHKLVSLPDLFGFSSEFDLDGRTTTEVEDALRWVERNRPWVRVDLATSLEDLRYRCRRIELLDLETPPEVAAHSRFAWMETGPNQFRLHLAQRESLVVAPTILGDWEVSLRTAAGEKTIAAGASLTRAVKAADQFVTASRADSLRLVDRRSRWREEPASEKQIAILRERKLSVPAGLTKGQASRLIAMVADAGGREGR